MEKLQKLVEKNPKFKSDRSEYLKLAVKEGNAVRGTGPHHVKLVGCENATNKDYQTQKEVKGVNLLFEEAGLVKKYFIPTLGDDGKFHYLIERFAEIEEGTDLILEYKRKEGSVKGFIDVQSPGKASSDSGEEVISIDEGEKSPKEDVEDEEIPVVEESEEEIKTEDILF